MKYRVRRRKPQFELGDRVNVIWVSMCKVPIREWTGTVKDRFVEICNGTFSTYFYSVEYDDPKKYGEIIHPPKYIFESYSLCARMEKI